MTITKILKNVSGSTRNVLNRQMANNESYLIPVSQWTKLADHERTHDDITAGLVVVNNGTINLNPAAGILHVKKMAPDSAPEISFDPAGTALTSTNVRAAIIEARASAIGIGRFALTTTFNSTVSNNDWLGFSELIPGNETPIRLPVKCRLKEMHFSYRNNNLLGIPLGGDQISGRFDLYKNGLSSPANVVWQGSFVNQAGGKLFTNVNVDFNQSDWITGRWIDQGSNPADMAIIYIFEVRE